MNSEPLTTAELNEFEKYFGISFEEISLEDFNKIHKQLQAKFHPDNFEKHGDETVKEMAVEKFQHIELLSNKAKYWLENKLVNSGKDKNEGNIFLDANAQYAFEGMYIEIITSDKDLKYHLFGSSYRWLEMGDNTRYQKHRHI